MKARISRNRAVASGDQRTSSGWGIVSQQDVYGGLGHELGGFFVRFSADAFRWRQLVFSAPGQEPSFHVFMADVMPGFDLAAGEAEVGAQALLVGEVGFDGIGNQEVGAAAGFASKLRQTLLG